MEMRTVIVPELGKRFKTYMPDLVVLAYKKIELDAYVLPAFLEVQAI